MTPRTMGDPGQGTVLGSMARVVEVTQGLVAGQFELARLETRDDMVTVTKGMILTLAALPILIIGWLATMAGIIMALSPFVPLHLSLALLGLAHVALGAIGTYRGLSRMKREGASATITDSSERQVSETDSVSGARPRGEDGSG